MDEISTSLLSHQTWQYNDQILRSGLGHGGIYKAMSIATDIVVFSRHLPSLSIVVHHNCESIFLVEEYGHGSTLLCPWSLSSTGRTTSNTIYWLSANLPLTNVSTTLSW